MKLNPADAAFAARLEPLLPPDTLRRAAPRYLEEPRGRHVGQGGLLALPRNTQEVSLLVSEAAAMHVPVVPYGGGTGLVAGQVKAEGPKPLIVSLERMARVRNVYPRENVLVAEAGAILSDVQLAAREAGRLFPLSLASEGTARIGGNLATNAGGMNVLRYGNARELCLGIEAVLPDGRIMDGLTRLRKDNTGYDLKNLLIGAEGTLGIITAAALKLFPIPAAIGTAFLVVPSPQAALDLLALARDRLGETVSAFELVHRLGLQFVTDTLPDIRLPFASPPDWSVLIEVGLPAGADPQDALAQLFEAAQTSGLTSDGVIAASRAQRAALWSVREHIPEANRRIGSVASHDVSLPLDNIPEFIRRGSGAVAELGPFRINCFGHLGDGNLHYNVFPPAGTARDAYADIRTDVTRAVHDLVADLGGSFSAEHGVGRAKVAELERYGDPARLETMRAIKSALDPAGIMNPGAVLRAGGDVG